jgi:mRNA interferase RelE/StbE
MYSIIIAKSALKDLKAIPEKFSDKISLAIDNLEEDPRPSGCKKLLGGETLFRIRIGNYRVIYQVDDHQKQILIGSIKHRRDAYKDL